jgi:AcrR family transcriptional regulator
MLGDKMKHEFPDAKRRLLDAAIALLGDTPDPDALTVRRIAKHARMGIGLINYHFGSKENLLDEAIGELMRKEAGLDISAGTPRAKETADVPPAALIREILKRTARTFLRYPALARLTVRRALLAGDYGSERTILPILRLHFGAELSEPELRVTAIQIVTPIQAMALRPEDVEVFTGLDLTDESIVDRVIDRLVDNILVQPKGGKSK